MLRLTATFLFLTVMLGVSDCQAQGRRGLLFRQMRVEPNAFHHDSNLQNSMPSQPWSQRGQLSSTPHQIWQQPVPVQSRQLSNYRNPTISRILDGPTNPQRRNPAEVNSRYIGGFHQSHFSNIGIPSGDIGIRGNAYNWRTW